MAALDHIVLAVPNLATAVATFAATTGVEPVPGGSHVGLGTANYLVGLGGTAYLEIVGPDPTQPEPAAPRPFGIDELPAARVVTWAVATSDINALVATARTAGYDPGDAVAMSRATPTGELLEWRLTPARLTAGCGLVPFVIDWGVTPHPTGRGLPQAQLLDWRATHPDPVAVRPALDALGAELAIESAGAITLTAVVQGAAGPVTFR